MNVQFSKVFTEFFLILGSNVFKVLVPKNNDATLGNQQGKFIFLRVGEAGELQSANLSANSWR